MWKSLLIFIILVLGFYLFYKGLTLNPSHEIVGDKAPIFTTYDIANQKFDLNDVLHKKVILINFWATWCDPCREEIPILNKIHQEFSHDSFYLIGIMEDEVPSNEILLTALNRFKSKVPIDFPVFKDSDGLIADLYGTYQIPESYLIDLNGTVIYKHEGIITSWDQKEIVKKIKGLIKSQ